MRFYRPILSLMLAALLTASYVYSASQNTSVYLPLVITEIPPIVSSNTVVLSAATMEGLEGVPTNGVLVFKESTPELSRIKIGSIIVSEPSVSAPDGLIRKVTSVTVQANQIVVQTNQAAIDEIFDQISFSADGTFPLTTNTSAASMYPQASAIGCSLSREHNVAVQTGLSFTVNIDPELPKFHLEVRKGPGISIRHLAFTASAAISVNIQGSISPNITSSSFSIDLLTCKAPPIIIPIAGVPIPIVPVITFNAGIDISNSGGSTAYSFEAMTTGQFTAGFVYFNGQLTDINQAQGTSNFTQLPAGQTGMIKPHAGFTIGLLTGGLAEAGIEAGIDVYARWGQDDPAAVYTGIEAVFAIVLDMYFFQSEPATATFTLLEYRFPRSPIPTPTPMLTPIPNPPDYTVTDLGTLGGSDSYAYGINNSGQVVGSSKLSSGVDHAFIWQSGVMTDLGTLGGSDSYAYGINNSGQVVGSSKLSSGVDHAFIWQSGVMTDLGTLGGANSYAYDINNAGQVVGAATTSTGSTHAFIWQNGVMTDLGTLGGSDSYAYGINDIGQVVGSSDGAGTSLPFLWRNSQMVMLFLDKAEARSINNNTQVVGTSFYVGGNAFLWQNNNPASLPYPGNSSFAYDINDSGTLVGKLYNRTGAPNIAVWKNRVVISLGIPGEARSINSAGHFVGQISGTRHAFLATPLS